MSQAGVSFPRDDFHDSIGAVIPIGGPDQWVLGSLESRLPSADSPPTRLVWASLARKKIEGRQVLTQEEKVLDYYAPSRQLLTCAEVDNNTILTIWEVLPTDEAAKPIVRWQSPGRIRGIDAPWVRILPGNLVIHQGDRQEYNVWDTAKKRLAYSFKQESFFAPDIAMSPGRAYLLIPEDKQVRILEAASGNALSVLPMEDRATAVAVDEEGRRLAVLSPAQMSVWDLTQADAAPRTYQAEALAAPFNARIEWVSPTRIMMDAQGLNSVLFSLEQELALWQYRPDVIDAGSWDGRTHQILKGHLVYAASLDRRSGYAIGAVQLPGPKVDETAASINRDELLALKPGDRIRLSVSAGQYQQQVQAALEKKIADNGWILDSTAPNVMIAEMKRGESQQIAYESFDRREQQTVTVSPYISSLRIDVQQKTAWQSGSSSGGAPAHLRLREGQSAQDEVNKWQQPNPNFFNGVQIPAKIMDPAKRNGFGVTTVSNRGLVPQGG